MRNVIFLICLLLTVSCAQLSRDSTTSVAPACPRSQAEVEQSSNKARWMLAWEIRHRRPSEIAVFLNEVCDFASQHPEAHLIIGPARVIADDRTSVLLIMTKSENRPFFEDWIRALDVEIADKKGK